MENEWIKIPKDVNMAIPNEDCWVFNILSGMIEFSPVDGWLPLNRYSHYMIVKKPLPPK